MKNFYLFIIFYILLLSFLSCKKTGETITISNYIYEEKPTPTVTATVTAIPTP